MNESFEKPAWNSSELFLQRIEKFWLLAGEAKLSGISISYFRSLEVVYMSTHDFFNKEEQKECEERIKKIENLLETNYGRGTTAQATRSAGLWAGENECDKLYKLLSRLLIKYDLTYYKQKSVTWQQELEDDFK